MRDPAVDVAAKKVAGAIDEAEQFLRARSQRLDATPYDWSDARQRAEIHLRLGYPLRWLFASGRHLGLPDCPTMVEIYFPPERIWPMSDAEAEAIFKRIVKPEPLPRGKGRYQKGPYIPRDVAIVQAIKYIHQRYGFPAIGGEQKTKKNSATTIVRVALQRLGVILRQRTIDDIWSNRVRSNSAN